MYWWHIGRGFGNFGDELGAKIITKVFGKKVVRASKHNFELISCGSIIDFVIGGVKNFPKIIWTSGFLLPGNSTISSGDFKVVAVRGKLSRSRVDIESNRSIVLGDLGLLSSYILGKKKIEKRFKIGVIPHHREVNHKFFKNKFFEGDTVKFINPLGESEDVVEQIASCEAVVSSSLHGLIVADSLKIPNCYFQLKNKAFGGMYKYYDYYSVFSKNRLKVIDIKMIKKNPKPQSLIDLVVSKYIPADEEVDGMKRRLWDSFEEVISLLMEIRIARKGVKREFEKEVVSTQRMKRL